MVHRSFAAVVLACFAFNASASVITLSTGFNTAGVQTSAAGYKTAVEAALLTQAQTPKAGYGTKVLSTYDKVSNASVFGAGSDVAWKATINFDVSAVQAGSWSFRTGVDFDYGGALFIDGVAATFSSANMYWGNTYTDTTQFLQTTMNLAAGNHTLTIYGLEHCCDGLEQAQFKAANSTAFTTFSSTDGLKAAAVPEPGTLISMSLGLFALIGVRRRRYKRG